LREYLRKEKREKEKEAKEKEKKCAKFSNFQKIKLEICN